MPGPEDWAARFGGAPPFKLPSAAGDEDEFVPAWSSLDPFSADQQAAVYGNHLEIVKPQKATELSVQLVIKLLAGDAAPAGPWSSARVAVELRQFQQAVDQLWGHRVEMDDRTVVALALALESIGRQQDAIDLLTQRQDANETDAMGVLAGRLKRRWLAEHRRDDAERADQLYRSALERAQEQGRADQSFYHGINVAFMSLAYRQDRAEVMKYARMALFETRRAPEEKWNLATQGEAHLLLGEDEVALVRYRLALVASPTPREVDSMYQQAVRVAQLLERR